MLMASLSKQKGDAMIEALVSIVLLSFIMIGLTFLVAKTAMAQKNTSVQNMALFALRSAAQTQGLSSLCAAANPSITVVNQNVALTAQCQRNAFTATVAGQTINVAAAPNSPITASTLTTKQDSANAAFIGGDGVISLN
jgi:Tfp pilus assembly protein PilV